ncbi:putative calvin cycle protein CP12 [Helianthus annuus]|nr:putative calvin cycle protein CP12 [Helianthus annuus]KAJ0732646.1 putative calvin cycle protein CP12 [Helianthus annuus]KAJ0906294.1 putative calvin cycle protein CP12 [Helianthus annuus]
MATFSSTFVASIRSLNTVRSTSSTNQSNNQRRLKPVVAMGGTARYKGTHMREMKLAEMIERKVTEAEKVCAGDEGSDECKVAWDEVEEISQAKAHLRVKLERDEDPMEEFCSGDPETEECTVVYDG